MNTFCGPFSELEGAFLSYIKALKEKDAMAGVLVISPSRKTADRLEKLIAASFGACPNVFFGTFVSVTAKLAAASINLNTQKLVGSNFNKYLLKHLLNNNRHLINAAVTDGLAQGLLSSLRDLQDSLIEPALIAEHLADDTGLSAKDKDSFARLLKLLQIYTSYFDSLPVKTRTGLYKQAIAFAAQSPYIKKFGSVIFYGFYDLTGIQFELFESIKNAASNPVLFYPYVKHNAYKFNERFYGEKLLGMSSNNVLYPITKDNSLRSILSENLFNSAKAFSPPATDAVRIIDASGSKDEVFAAAKEVLRLKNKGVNYEDIAVCFRAAGEYEEEIVKTFSDNKIPFTVKLKKNLLSHPLAWLCSNLLNFRAENFSYRHALTMLNSVYFNAALSGAEVNILKNYCVASGFNCWQNVLGMEPKNKEHAPVLKKVAKLLSSLNKELAALESSFSWSALSAGAIKILDKYINAKALNKEARGIFDLFAFTVKELGDFDFVAPAKPGDFLEELNARLNAAQYEKPSEFETGVTVSDVMGIRAQNFKAVIMLGLNEGLFPLTVNEDALLRDKVRAFLSDALGYPIRPLKDRHQEERLLFYLAATSASDYLTCIYQRSDSQGKSRAPSLFLHELERAVLIKPENKISVARAIKTKYELLSLASLTGQELLILAVLSNNPAKNSALVSSDGIYNGLIETAQSLKKKNVLTEFDGLISSGNNPYYGTHTASATSVETLKTCPMKFFFEKKLGLKSEYVIYSRTQYPAIEKGNLFHKILELYYKTRTEEGTKRFTHDETVFDSVFEAAAQSFGGLGLYPLLWKILKEDIKAAVLNFINEDIAGMGLYAPKHFEYPVSGIIKGVNGITWFGKMDRIDINENGSSVKINDYKSRVRIRNIENELYKGNQFQVYIYIKLLADNPPFNKYPAINFSLVNLYGYLNEGELKVLNYDSGIAAIQESLVNEKINYAAGLDKNGEYFFIPDSVAQNAGNYCSFCDYSFACGKSRLLPRLRMQGSAQYKIYCEVFGKDA